MGSQFDEALGGVGWSLLSEQLGQPITQYRQQAATGTTVTAIVGSRQSKPDATVGRDNVRSLMLTMPDSVPVTLRDTWLINDEIWTTREFTQVPGNLVQVQVQHIDRDRRHGAPHS